MKQGGNRFHELVSLLNQDCFLQPRSQGLSSFPLSLAPGDGKKKDPRNEVVVPQPNKELVTCLTLP